MNILQNVVKLYRDRCREQRRRVFLGRFSLTDKTCLLDLGSESGLNINYVLSSSGVKPENVYLTDINEFLLLKGEALYSYNPVYIDASENCLFLINILTLFVVLEMKSNLL